MQAYTYSIRHLPTNRIYYGVRKSTIIDIGITYFSSSKLVKRLLSTEPIANFNFKVSKLFPSYEEARLHETKFLIRINAITNPMVLNQAISSPRLCSKDPVAESRRRSAISKKMTELWETPEYKNNQSFNKLSKEEQTKRGTAGAKKRANNYTSGKTLYKDKKEPVYKNISIIRNNISKIIKQNQYAAYAKCGWNKHL